MSAASSTWNSLEVVSFIKHVNIVEFLTHITYNKTKLVWFEIYVLLLKYDELL